VDRAAAAIAGQRPGALDREQALIVADAQVTLKRVRRMRVQIMELVLPSQSPDARDSPSMAPAERSVLCVDQLSWPERYEHRAFARQKKAVRIASLRDPGDVE
jgi:hypothetical protein